MWDTIDGQKQNIGLVIFGLGCVLDLLGIPIGWMIRDLGGAIAGGGALHRVDKTRQAQKALHL